MFDYPKKFIAARENLILETYKRRQEYRVMLREHLESINLKLITPDDLEVIPKSAFLLSSSRSGSSVTADILSQYSTGYKGTESILLCLPGELKPYFDISLLSPPFVDTYSNELSNCHAKDLKKVNVLFTELMSDIGYPTKETSDIIGYAIAIYGRLLLQWPTIDFGNSERAVSKIYKIVKSLSVKSNGIFTYINTSEMQILLLRKLKAQFPEIDLKFYDMNQPGLKSVIHPYIFFNADHFIEEPPFILPVPWHFATIEELKRGILFIKDPSNSWRIPFWREILQNQSISWLHLTRNAVESINGLRDGWLYPFGFITNRSPKPLKISGYTRSELHWTKWYAKFSTSNQVWNLLLHEKPVDIEHICAFQWADAHKSIIENVSKEPSYYKISSKNNPLQFGFEWLRINPVEAITQICEKLDITPTQSLIDVANNMNSRHIQSTPGTNGQSDRWKNAERRDLLIKYSQESEIAKISQQLGYQ